MESSETQIIASCQNGEMESFVILYDRYVEKIYTFLHYRTGHVQIAEDITSQTFIRAMEKIGQFKENKGTFQAWLYQIARNIMIDEARKRKPTENIEAHYDIAGDNSPETNPEINIEQQITNKKISALLQELPDNQRELVQMRLWDELSYAEIAVITGKSEGSLKMQFSRIVGNLKQHAHLFIVLLLFSLNR